MTRNGSVVTDKLYFAWLSFVFLSVCCGLFGVCFIFGRVQVNPGRCLRPHVTNDVKPSILCLFFLITA